MAPSPRAGQGPEQPQFAKGTGRNLTPPKPTPTRKNDVRDGTHMPYLCLAGVELE